MVFALVRPYRATLVEPVLVNIFNPSSLKLYLGDLSMLSTSLSSSESAVFMIHIAFQMLSGGAILGTTVMPNLFLDIGNNIITASSSFNVSLC
jgi:hypothetical protein